MRFSPAIQKLVDRAMMAVRRTTAPAAKRTVKRQLERQEAFHAKHAPSSRRSSSSSRSTTRPSSKLRVPSLPASHPFNRPRKPKRKPQAARPKAAKRARARASAKPRALRVPAGYKLGRWQQLGDRRWARYMHNRAGSTAAKCIIEPPRSQYNPLPGWAWAVEYEYEGIHQQGAAVSLDAAKREADAAFATLDPGLL